jgi:hypothetical protein
VFDIVASRIKRLDLNMRSIEFDYILLLSSVVAPSLTTLSLNFVGVKEEYSYYDYAILESFMTDCLEIVHLRLCDFEFDDDPVDQTIIDGIKRLKQLELFNCDDEEEYFIEAVKPRNLESFSYRSMRRTDESNAHGLIATITSNCLLLTSITIKAPFESSFILLTITGDCPNLEKIYFADPGGPKLGSDVIEAFASLPYLTFLDVGKVDVEALAILSKCTRLKHLHIDGNTIDLHAFIPTIGKNLVSLRLKELRVLKIEKIHRIIENCPHLGSLSLEFKLRYDLVREGVVERAKKGLKRLSKFEVNGAAVRLGTDWRGY